MIISVRFDKDMPTYMTGGEYAVTTCEIYVDPDLPLRTQRALVIHAVIENFCPSWEHTKIEELEDLIINALDELGE